MHTCLVVVVSIGTMDMENFLQAARLDEYSAVLQNKYGAACVADLGALDDSELTAIGMKKIERKRLQRQLGRLREKS